MTVNKLGKQVVERAVVQPRNRLVVLSATEVNALCRAQDQEVYQLFRSCALAVLASGDESDDAHALSQQYADFDVRFEQVDRGIVLHLDNAPASAFVDGKMLVGIREHLFSVLRDIVFAEIDLADSRQVDDTHSAGVTEVVFRILRHADILRPVPQAGLVVCWGGHSIGPQEYDYTKVVGYQLGLRGLNICTGCGPGAMKGPMKGATIAHAKQRLKSGRYIGVSEPGIIAAEAPNAIVNELVILPDIEKRLEAFLRLAHGIVVFPGGVGTVEEILYLLSVMSARDNADRPLPVILTGPASSADYFAALDTFIQTTLGAEFARYYDVIIDDPGAVAKRLKRDIDAVLEHRDTVDDAAYFNWSLNIDYVLQQPFVATHASMAALELHDGLSANALAYNLRRAFSGVVSGNVKEQGIAAVAQHGPFELRASRTIATALDSLLRSFVAARRMRLPGSEYTPCYNVVS